MAPQRLDVRLTGPLVRCPACGSDWLQPDRVELYARPVEPVPFGLHVTLEGGHVHTSTDVTGNPSPSGDGLRVYFSCARCCAVPVLNLLHHKDHTFLEWEDQHPPTACGATCERYPSGAVPSSHAP